MTEGQRSRSVKGSFRSSRSRRSQKKPRPSNRYSQASKGMPPKSQPQFIASPSSSDVARGTKPSECILETRHVVPRMIAKIPNRLLRGEKHPVLGHAQRIGREERFLSGQSCHCLGAIGQRIKWRARQFPARRLAARKRCDRIKHLLQSDVLTAQNVDLANLAFLESQDVPFGNVVDMHQIEAG